MKSLIKIIKKITDILCQLEVLLRDEQKNLLKKNTNIKIFKSIMKKKIFFLKNYMICKQKEY